MASDDPGESSCGGDPPEAFGVEDRSKPPRGMSLESSVGAHGCIEAMCVVYDENEPPSHDGAIAAAHARDDRIRAEARAERTEEWRAVVWEAVAAFGGDPTCEGCRKVVRKLGTGECYQCIRHPAKNAHEARAEAFEEMRALIKDPLNFDAQPPGSWGEPGSPKRMACSQFARAQHEARAEGRAEGAREERKHVVNVLRERSRQAQGFTARSRALMADYIERLPMRSRPTEGEGTDD